MPAFHYVALGPKGALQKGVLEAGSLREARQQLRDKGSTPLEVDAVHQKTSAVKTVNKLAMNNKELALMTRQCATLLAAGLPLEEVLAAVSEQTEKAPAKALILAVRSKVLEGHALASCLKDFPKAFSPLYCATVAAGEKSGHLDIVLQRLADYTEQQFQMRQKITHALVYPTIMIGVALAIVGFLLEFVVPKMINVYSNIGQTLPMMTTILISFSEGLKKYGVYGFVFSCLCVFIFRLRMKAHGPFRETIHRALLTVPILEMPQRLQIRRAFLEHLLFCLLPVYLFWMRCILLPP